MREYMEWDSVDSIIRGGEISRLEQELEGDFERLAMTQDFKPNMPLLLTLWESYPAVTRRLLLNWCDQGDGKKLVRMLEVAPMEFQFQWDKALCYVNGNVLFRAVWNGEYELVKRFLELGMNPDGACTHTYLMRSGEELFPYSRWGKMKVTSQENEFFMFDVWGGSFYDNDREEEHIITPLYLAQLQRDQRMVCILKEAGACDVPSREKMWEEVKTSEN